MCEPSGAIAIIPFEDDSCPCFFFLWDEVGEGGCSLDCGAMCVSLFVLRCLLLSLVLCLGLFLLSLLLPSGGITGRRRGAFRIGMGAILWGLSR